jgi:hypothetical protein
VAAERSCVFVDSFAPLAAQRDWMLWLGVLKEVLDEDVEFGKTHHI